MPLAATNLTIIRDTIRAPDVPTLVNGIAAVLTAAGWTVTTVTDGYKATCISPQGLQIALFVRDLGHQISFVFPFTATLNFQTIDGTITGADHELGTGIGVDYTAVFGICYVNLFRPGINQVLEGSCFFGGIPFVPKAVECGHEIPAFTTNQAFWAMGDAGSSTTTPRLTLITNGQNMNGAEALWNTDYCPGGNPVGSLRIAALTVPVNITNGFNVPSPILWANGVFLDYEPLLCWGETNAVLPVYRGQPWDALIFSKKEEMDHEDDLFGYTWICLTDEWQYGTYAIIAGIGSAPPGGSQAYAFSKIF